MKVSIPARKGRNVTSLPAWLSRSKNRWGSCGSLRNRDNDRKYQFLYFLFMNLTCMSKLCPHSTVKQHISGLGPFTLPSTKVIFKLNFDLFLVFQPWWWLCSWSWINFRSHKENITTKSLIIGCNSYKCIELVELVSSCSQNTCLIH